MDVWENAIELIAMLKKEMERIGSILKGKV